MWSGIHFVRILRSSILIKFYQHLNSWKIHFRMFGLVFLSSNMNYDDFILRIQNNLWSSFKQFRDFLNELNIDFL